MLNIDNIKEILRKQYPYLASEYGVKKIGLFGMGVDATTLVE